MGASWSWQSGYGNLNYWKYEVDSRRTGNASYDSSGRGLDASIGTYTRSVGLDGGLSYRRSDDLVPSSLSVEDNYDAYLTATYKPDRLPDISVSGAIGQYGYKSLVYSTAVQDSYWSATLGLDFSKFLWQSPGAPPTTVKRNEGDRFNSMRAIKSPYANAPMLKLLYRYLNEANQALGAKSDSSQLFGLMFATRL
jgi:hypothetical protein